MCVAAAKITRTRNVLCHKALMLRSHLIQKAYKPFYFQSPRHSGKNNRRCRSEADTSLMLNMGKLMLEFSLTKDIFWCITMTKK